MAEPEVFQLFGTETVSLDNFQQILLQMTSNASAGALSKFFSKNYRPLYQFILRLYLTSLSAPHPDRGRTQNDQDDEYTVKEHKIMAEWANLLTDDEPLHKDEDIDLDLLSDEDENENIAIEIEQASSPNISASNTSTLSSTDAKVEDLKDITQTAKKKKKRKKRKKDHKESQQSFSGLAQFTTAIAMMRSNPQSAFDAYSNKKKVEFVHLSHEEKQNSYHRNRNADSSRRDSIWEGVLDVNNIIMVPETPKWRPHFSFQQNQLLQEGLLDAILQTISPYKRYEKGNDTNLTLVDEVKVTSVDAICLYLPFLCVISTKLSSKTKRNDLQSVILQRVLKEYDIKQHFQFVLNSYKNATDLKKSFASHAQNVSTPLTASEDHESYAYDSSVFESIEDLRRSSTNVSIVSNTSTSSSSNHNKAQHIVQTEAESAISLFQSIFRQHLGAGSEIKLCRESQISDPLNNNAPPLSRIEVRKQIQTKSKPYLIDLYVANRVDNFEFLSSTAILKKGDDLRRDQAILHVFRLMNKIWREKGLEFTQVPVNAFTYKCVAISPEFGMIELIEGCKPLRLVSALEDTITIAQQFNLVASAAGSYVASYVMGVRDRHFDNVLIRDSDCTLFHIDFGFVLGDTATMDTSKFAITKDLKKLMGVFWDKFIELGVQAFLALRQKHQFLIKYARVAFEYLEKGEMVQDFIKHQLLVDDMADNQAAKYIARKLKESPDSVKTKFKNVVHQIATIKK